MPRTMNAYLDDFADAITAMQRGERAQPICDIPLPDALLALRDRLHLSPDDALLLALTCAPNYDHRIARHYGALLGRAQPNPLNASVLSRLLALSLYETRARFESVFTRHGRLLQMKLLRLADDGVLHETPALSGILFQRDSLPESWSTFAEHTRGRAHTPILPGALTDRLETIHGAWDQAPSPPLTWLLCRSGMGRSTLALHLAQARNQSVIEIHADRAPDALHALELVREARTLDAALLIHLDDVSDIASWRARIETALLHDVSVVASTAQLARQPRASHARSSVLLRIPEHTTETRRALWARILPPRMRHRSLDEDWLTFRFRGTTRELTTLARHALDQCMLSTHPPRVTAAILESVAQHTLVCRLESLATRCTPLSAGLSSIILEPHQREQLEELVVRVRHRIQVMDRWGFGHTSYGLGTVALLSGPPGTGKTLSARAVCTELQLPLFRVDLSMVVSKWVGETEKNLSALFDEAESAGAALLFDEADTLFARRGEVKGAGDQHANLKVGYLLQRIEAFSGLCFLTTNLAHSIDAAFIRRVSTHVQFSLPEGDERRTLWRSAIPDAAPLDHDVDFETLAHDFEEMSGGDIRTAAMRAAFIACQQDLPITQAMLAYAAARTLRDSGALIRFEKPERWTDDTAPAHA